MKHMRKLASLLLALALVLTLAATAFAAEATGSITINNATDVSVAGKTFNAYKILDLELVGTDGYVYTVPAELKNFYATEFALDATSGDFDYEVTQKIAAMKDDADKLFVFAAKALAAAKAANITPATVTGAGNATSVKFEGLPLGYYVIEDAGAATPISALMLDSTNPDVTITIKADKPELEKKIDGNKDTDDDTKGEVDYNNVAIGDKIPYVLHTAVPDMTGYTKYFFVVTDTLSKGLTFNNDVEITLGGEPLTVGDDYTVTVTKNDDGTTTVKIVFVDFIQYKDQVEAKIDITYSATLDEDAVIGIEGNPNEVKLTYSNNPNKESSGKPENPNEPDSDDPTGETPKDTTYTYTTDLEIIKVDDKGNKLTGATFTLSGTKINKVLVTTQQYVENADGEYFGLTNGTFTTEAPDGDDGDTNYIVDSEGKPVKYALINVTNVDETSEKVTATVAVGEDGKLNFAGLSAGTYTITEIKAPAGYNLLDKPIEVTITWTAPVEGSTDCTWTYKGTDTEGENEVATNHVTVINQTGTELPSTGGIGTTIFYILGAVLAVAAVVLLVTKKRMASAE